MTSSNQTFIEDLLIIEPKVHFDKRGYFESFNHKEFNELIGADVKLFKIINLHLNTVQLEVSIISMENFNRQISTCFKR